MEGRDLVITRFIERAFPCIQPSCCSVARACLTLCDLTDCNTAGFPVLHHFPELAQKPHGLQFELQFESNDHPFSSGFIKILSIMLLLPNLGNAQ